MLSPVWLKCPAWASPIRKDIAVGVEAEERGDVGLLDMEAIILEGNLHSVRRAS